MNQFLLKILEVQDLKSFAKNDYIIDSAYYFLNIHKHLFTLQFQDPHHSKIKTFYKIQ